MQKSKKILAILLIFRRNRTKKTDSQEEIRLLYCILSMCLGFSKKKSRGFWKNVPRKSEKRPDVFYNTCLCSSVDVSIFFGMCGD